MEKILTLGEFIIENQNAFPYSTGELSKLLNSIRLAAKMVNHEVNKAGLVDIIGGAGDVNVQGENQQKLNVFLPELGTFYSVGEANGLKGEKRSLFAGGVRIPFLVRWPETIPSGVINKTTELSTVDLLPTFLNLAQTDLPDGYQPDGVSIVDALKGKDFKREKAIYWNWLYSSNRPGFWPGAAIQEDNWKLLTNNKLEKTELYNISTDWAEQKDVSTEYPEKVSDLLKKLGAFEQTLPKNPPTDCFSKERLKKSIY